MYIYIELTELLGLIAIYSIKVGSSSQLLGPSSILGSFVFYFFFFFFFLTGI